MMVAGDFPRFPFGITSKILPLVLLSWSKLYLVILCASFLAFVFASAPRSLDLRPAKNFSFSVFVLSTAFLISSVFSQQLRMSAESFLYFAGLLFLVYLAGLVLADMESLEPLWRTLSLAILFLALKVIFWRFGEGLEAAAYLILNNSWVGKLQIAWILNFFAPFFFARYVKQRGLWSWVNGLAWAMSGAAIFLLFSRAGTVIFAVTATALCILHLKEWKKWIGIGLILGVGVGIFALKSLHMSRYVFKTTANLLAEEGIERRVTIWKDSLRMFWDHPIAGIGFGAYDELAFSRYGAPYDRIPDERFRKGGWHAHNVFLHILAETGVIGFGAWIFFLYTLALFAVRSWRSSQTEMARSLSAAMGLFLLAFMVHSLTENLIAVRVHQSFRMNLAIGFLVLLSSYSIHYPKKIEPSSE